METELVNSYSKEHRYMNKRETLFVFYTLYSLKVNCLSKYKKKTIKVLKQTQIH